MMRKLTVCVFVFGILVSYNFAFAETVDMIKAQIGIKVISGNGAYPAEKSAKVTRGDKIRIYVVPRFENAYVYVLHRVKDEMTRLEDRRTYPIASRYLLTFPVPSERELLFEDRTKEQEEPVLEIENTRETFIILCSPKPLAELEELFQRESVSAEQWEELEGTYQDSRLALGVTFGKPLNMAGTARSVADDFSEHLKTYSGDSLIMTEYTFRAKK